MKVKKSVYFLSFIVLLTLFTAVSVFAQASPAAPAQPEGQQFFGYFVSRTAMYFLLIFGVYYFIVIQPKDKRNHERKKFLEGLKRNSEVLTTGGIYGRVIAVKPDYVIVEIAPKVEIRVHPENLLSVPEVKSQTTPAKEQKKGNGK